jgi:hypothetical protein
MIPFILGIAAAASSAITAGQAVAIGASIGAATVAGAKMLSKNQQPESFVPDTADDEELDELIELIRERKLRIRTKV